MERDYLGVGWAFPVDVDPRGRIAVARFERDIEQAIQMILLTPKGQRVRRFDFGCQIHDLMFAPNDATTMGLASYYVEEALRAWEPRIIVTSVDVRGDDANDGRLLIDINYEIKATHDRRSLVFPFYRMPGD